MLLGVVTALFSSCASMQSMSSYARTGDTVTIALGGTEDSNALVEVLKKEDINITITDINGNTYPITLRHLFRLYPDHSSSYVYKTDKNSGSQENYSPPFIGQWMATIDLIDPVTSSMPTLAIGAATISVSSPSQLIQAVYYEAFGANYSWTNGDLGSIDIEILPGQGTSNSLNYLQPVNFDPIAALEPMPQFIISPSASPMNNIAGGSFSFVYNPSDFVKGVVATPANHDPNVQITSIATTLANGNKQLNVTILNPKGFINNNKRTGIIGAGTMGVGKMSPLRSVRFNLVFSTGAIANDDANWQNYIQMISGEYIDLAGNPVIDISPVMKKVR